MLESLKIYTRDFQEMSQTQIFTHIDMPYTGITLDYVL
jgi:hypothetical protein